MNYKIQIQLKPGIRDQHGEHVKQEINSIGVTAVESVQYFPLYKIEGNIGLSKINEIASNLLIDPITEKYSINYKNKRTKNHTIIEVWLKPGVTDTVAESVLKGIKDLNIKDDLKIKTGQKYIFTGNASKKEIERITKRLIVNTLIHEIGDGVKKSKYPNVSCQGLTPKVINQHETKHNRNTKTIR